MMATNEGSHSDYTSFCKDDHAWAMQAKWTGKVGPSGKCGYNLRQTSCDKGQHFAADALGLHRANGN